MKHTKGPWTYDETYGLIMAGETIEVAACHAGRGGDAKANARLIAAAPEMLELIEELADQPGQLHEDVIRMKRLIAQIKGK
jgi:hypothetical protein